MSEQWQDIIILFISEKEPRQKKKEISLDLTQKSIWFFLLVTLCGNGKSNEWQHSSDSGFKMELDGMSQQKNYMEFLNWYPLGICHQEHEIGCRLFCTFFWYQDWSTGWIISWEGKLLSHVGLLFPK